MVIHLILHLIPFLLLKDLEVTFKMEFRQHKQFAGQHAFLSASKYHWINYDQDKLDETYRRFRAAAIGTRKHALAAELIEMNVRLPRTRSTLNLYVNDAIGFKMTPEQVLYYSVNAFGTADAISYDERKKMLRIHDLKTGETPVSFHQLEVYEALFCLEYKLQPNEFQAELRIYQNDEVQAMEPDSDDIFNIMDKIILFDKRIEELKMEV